MVIVAGVLVLRPEAHFETDHIKTWHRRIAEVGIVGRDIKAWDAGSPESL